MDETAFLNAILAAPADSAPRLIYADWLDEQTDLVASAKCAFIRESEGKASAEALQRLAAFLDPDWLVIVSRLPVDQCKAKRDAAERPRSMRLNLTGAGQDFRCSLRWEDLRILDDKAVRFCEQCKSDVHYAETIMAARDHAAQGHCVAVDLGIKRREGDLAPEVMWMGRPSVETVRAEAERVKPDPVSAAREARRSS